MKRAFVLAGLLTATVFASVSNADACGDKSLSAGGIRMQAATATPVDVVVVIQALVVLFVATPQLVRSLFRRSGDGAELRVATRGW